MSMQLVYEKKGDVHTFNMGIPGLEKLVIDYTGIPANERAGLAKQLLMAAAIACYSSSLSGALDARKTRYDSITATSSLEFGTNAVGQKRITGMSLDFSVRMNGEDSAIFERVAKVMRNGCLVTGSLHDGIEMKYRLEADCEE